jgi:MoaA/NifB/PqqE/SkfB family radical SAM enzyme
MKIFICASKYNYHHINKIAMELKKAGHILTFPNLYHDPFYEERVKKISYKKHGQVKRKYLKLQAKKVEQNDAVFVINRDEGKQKNYIGGATFLEMYKAFELKKKIFLLNPIPKGILEDEIIGFNPTIINGDLNLIK